MNRSSIKSMLLGAGLGALSGMAIAATDSVVVTATISEVITVVLSNTAGATFAVTAGNAVTDQAIATITISSNDPDGYDVTLEGTNATSVLENGAADETMAYTVKYDGGSAIGMTTTPTNVENTTAQTAGAVARTLTLSIAGSESTGKSAEAFTDTITVEILGK